MTFSRTSPTLIIIDHTGVPDSVRGKGVGQALAASRGRGGTRRRLEDHPALPVLQGPGPTQPGLAGCDFMNRHRLAG
jgi:hypothetical protein